jgi:hypothetical protein
LQDRVSAAPFFKGRPVDTITNEDDAEFVRAQPINDIGTGAIIAHEYTKFHPYTSFIVFVYM